MPRERNFEHYLTALRARGTLKTPTYAYSIRKNEISNEPEIAYYRYREALA